MLDRIRRLGTSPTARAALGFFLGYQAMCLLFAAVVDLVADVDDARLEGFGEGFAQARRELADELGLTLDDEPLRAPTSAVDEPAVDAWAATTDDPQA